MEFTIELINHFENGENRKYTQEVEWTRPEHQSEVGRFHPCLEYSELSHDPIRKTEFIKDNALHFRISDIKPLS